MSLSTRASGCCVLSFNGVTIVVSLVPASTSACVAISAIPFTVSLASGAGVHTACVSRCTVPALYTCLAFNDCTNTSLPHTGVG